MGEDQEHHDTEETLIQERLRKLEELKGKGVTPYPYAFEKTRHAAALAEEFERLKKEEHSDEKVSVAGRLMQLRRMGKVTFAHLQDESGRIQLYFRANDLPRYDELRLYDLGDIIGASGTVFRTKTGELTVYVREFSLLAKTVRPLPEKYHGLRDTETRYRQRYLDLMMNPEVRKTFVTRATVIKLIRAYLDDAGFLEVETPTLQAVYGGGHAKPFTTHHNALDLPLYLRISNELYLKRLLVGGYERVYEIVKDFRNEGIDSTHNPEFTQVEWYEAWGDYGTGMRRFEELIAGIALKIHGTTKITYQGKDLDLSTPWKRLRMVDAIKEYAGLDAEHATVEELRSFMSEKKIAFKESDTRGQLLAALFEETCEEHLFQPAFIIDHPIETTPLCKPMRSGDATFVERFEPYIAGMEVGNAYSELNDPLLQRKLFEEQVKQRESGDDEAHPMDEDFVTALEYGMPPTSGVGLGIDRIVMIMTDAASIRDVILFPLMKPREE